MLPFLRIWCYFSVRKKKVGVKRIFADYSNFEGFSSSKRCHGGSRLSLPLSLSFVDCKKCVSKRIVAFWRSEREKTPDSHRTFILTGFPLWIISVENDTIFVAVNGIWYERRHKLSYMWYKSIIYHYSTQTQWRGIVFCGRIISIFLPENLWMIAYEAESCKCMANSFLLYWNRSIII